MKLLKLYILIAFAFFCAIDKSEAQKIKVVRTDVDTTRSGFITATYLFGIDVYADSVDNCNSASFVIEYDNADFIKYSGHQSTEFEEDGGTLIVIPQEDIANKTGKIRISGFSGKPLSQQKYKNPRIVHLEFAVYQVAAHNSEVTFSFTNPQITVNKDSSIVLLAHEPVKFKVHSFIDVYPGDTNNDGIVDIKDFSPIGTYMGFGSATKAMRSFKRQNASTMWMKQRVLAWDTATASFADCDGNGDITILDAHVVALNVEKKHSLTIAKSINDNPLAFNNHNNDLIDGKSILVPINVLQNESYISASGRILKSSYERNYKFIGTKQADLFDDEQSFALVKETETHLEFITGSFHHSNRMKPSGNLLYLAFESTNGTKGKPKLIVEDLMAMSNMAYTFPLNRMSSVDDIENNGKNINIKHSNAILNIEVTNDQINIYSIKMIDYLGNIVMHVPNVNRLNQIDIANLQSGIYYVQIEGQNYTQVFPISVIR